MRAGVMLLQDGPWEAVRDRALEADRLGFDTVWVADHIAEPYRPETDWLEAWTLLGALAALTRRCSLGALASSLTLRNPVLLVRAAQTLAAITGGRAELVLGAGGAPLEHDWTGISPWDSLERGKRYREAAGLINALLAGRMPTAAHYYPVKDVSFGAVAGVRFTMAALGRQAIQATARYAGSWNSYGALPGRRLAARKLTYDDTLGLFRDRSDRLDAACRAAGRDPSDVTRSYLAVETYLDPALQDPVAIEKMATDFRALGADEFVVYWLVDRRAENTMGQVLDAIKGTR